MPRIANPTLPDDDLARQLDALAGRRSTQPNALWQFKAILESPQVVLRAGGPGKESAAYAQAASDLLREAIAAIPDDQPSRGSGPADTSTRRIAEAMFCIGDTYDGWDVNARRRALDSAISGLYGKRRGAILLHIYNYLTVGAPQPVVNESFARTAIGFAYAGLCIDWMASVAETGRSGALPYGDAWSIAARQVRAQHSLQALGQLVTSLVPQASPRTGSAEDVLRAATGGSFRQLDPSDAARAGATSSSN